MNYGDPMIFFTLPISLALLIFGAILIALMFLPSTKKKRDEVFRE